MDAYSIFEKELNKIGSYNTEKAPSKLILDLVECAMFNLFDGAFIYNKSTEVIMFQERIENVLEIINPNFKHDLEVLRSLHKVFEKYINY